MPEKTKFKHSIFHLWKLGDRKIIQQIFLTGLQSKKQKSHARNIQLVYLHISNNLFAFPCA